MFIVTNTGKSVFNAIEKIAATSSKLEKESLIRQAGSSHLFMKVITYTYDPFKNYGISYVEPKSKDLAPGANKLEEDFVWKTLDDLITRRLSGDAARAQVTKLVNFLDDESSELFRRIIHKDMKAGFSEGTINRVFKGTIAEFPYMRCSLPAKSNMGKWDWGVGIISQEKADGMFANVNVNADKSIWITSRAGTMFPAGSLGLEADLANFLTPGTQTHGELIVYENDELMPREKGNGVLNSLLSGGSLESNQRVTFEAWDQIPLDAVVPSGKFETPYKARLAKLAKQCLAGKDNQSLRLIPTKIVHTKDLAYQHYRDLLKKGKEGVVVKHPQAIWKDTTSKDQVKLKLEVDVDLVVAELTPATPGTQHAATFGSLLCTSQCGKLRVGVSGFTIAKRQEIFENADNYIGSIISVRANSIMSPDDTNEDYSLFLPRYVEDRKDKRTADTLEQIQDQFQSATEGV